jgi:hypothetical protein
MKLKKKQSIKKPCKKKKELTTTNVNKKNYK